MHDEIFVVISLNGKILIKQIASAVSGRKKFLAYAVFLFEKKNVFKVD